MEKVRQYVYSHFNVITATLSGILALLYVWKGYKETFNVYAFVIIGLNAVYVPITLVLNKKIFIWFNTIYATLLVFVLAFTKTYLYNNYSALFIVCLISMLNPKMKKIIFPSYFAAVCVAYAINEETIYHFFIHITRSLWYLTVITAITYQKETKTKLILFPDEIKILQQLSQGNLYQKQVEGFSENTVYRKLKSARERNGCDTRDDLLARFEEEREENESSSSLSSSKKS